MSDKESADPSGVKSVVVDIASSSPIWHKVADLLEEPLDFCVHRIAELALNTDGFIIGTNQVNISLLLTDDDELQRLNRDFRNQDKPTNSLSFPSYQMDSSEYQKLFFGHENLLFLGDIAISYHRILDESLAQKKSFKAHFSHILVHSILHLIGYDHIQDDDAEKMEKIEIIILSLMGFKNPYLISDVDNEDLVKLQQ